MAGSEEKRLKPGGCILIILVVLALVYLGLDRFGLVDTLKERVLPRRGDSSTESAGGPDQGAPEMPPAPEIPAPAPMDRQPKVTTAETYEIVGAQPLPELKPSAVSAHGYTEEKPVRFAINIWPGWAPILAANGGMKANPESLFAQQYGFQVELVLIDDPTRALDAYLTGDVQVLWGTLDMFALRSEQITRTRDSRIIPRIPMQVDWSYGGDGIVARSHLRSLNGLAGKKVVLTQFSPSHFYALAMLENADIPFNAVHFTFVGDAFQAARAFYTDAQYDACVTWNPDLTTLVDEKGGGVKGAHQLTTTRDASRLIADVWAVRADFFRDYPEIVEGLVVGILKGMDRVKEDPVGAGRLLADAFQIDPPDATAMMADAHLTNYAENRSFFLQSGPSNYEAVWNTAVRVYRKIREIGTPIPSSAFKETAILGRIQNQFRHQKDEYVPDFLPVSPAEVEKRKQILTRRVHIQFGTNSYAPNIQDDPELLNKLDEIGRIIGQFGHATVVLVGNTDSTAADRFLKDNPSLGTASPAYRKLSEQAEALSHNRAEAIKALLVNRLQMPPEQITVDGRGWDNPVSDTASYYENRRVDVLVYPPEE